MRADVSKRHFASILCWTLEKACRLTTKYTIECSIKIAWLWKFEHAELTMSVFYMYQNKNLSVQNEEKCWTQFFRFVVNGMDGCICFESNSIDKQWGLLMSVFRAILMQIKFHRITTERMCPIECLKCRRHKHKQKTFNSPNISIVIIGRGSFYLSIFFFHTKKKRWIQANNHQCNGSIFFHLLLVFEWCWICFFFGLKSTFYIPIVSIFT